MTARSRRRDETSCLDREPKSDFRDCVPLVQRLARRVSRRFGTADDADDIAQETLVALLAQERRHGGSFLARDLPAYVASMVRNNARRFRNKQQRAGALGLSGDVATEVEVSRDHELCRASSAQASPEEPLGQSVAVRQRITALKSRLRPKDALVLELILAGVTDVPALAERLRTGENNVHQIRYRIWQALRALDTET